VRSPIKTSASVLTAVLALAGCGSDSVDSTAMDTVTVVESVDTQTTEDTTPLEETVGTTCKLPALATTVFRVTPGSRVLIPMAMRLDTGTITVDAPPTEWTSETIPAGIRLTVPYGSTGTHDIALELECEDGTDRTELTINVEPMTWSEVGPWQPGAGPAAREHPHL
jgi:hypothetical protein